MPGYPYIMCDNLVRDILPNKNERSGHYDFFWGLWVIQLFLSVFSDACLYGAGHIDSYLAARVRAWVRFLQAGGYDAEAGWKADIESF